MASIYEISAPDGSYYIGSTTRNMRRRMYEHRYYANTFVLHTPLSVAICKYGWNRMVTRVVLGDLRIIKSDLQHLEQFYITAMKHEHPTRICLNVRKAQVDNKIEETPELKLKKKRYASRYYEGSRHFRVMSKWPINLL
jgi:hypothetical protein